MPDPTPEPCGCRLRWVEPTRARAEIIYCPTHAAAFEYKNLASAQGDEIARLREQNTKLLAALEGCYPYAPASWQEQARAAIAEATGVHDLHDVTLLAAGPVTNPLDWGPAIAEAKGDEC